MRDFSIHECSSSERGAVSMIERVHNKLTLLSALCPTAEGLCDVDISFRSLSCAIAEGSNFRPKKTGLHPHGLRGSYMPKLPRNQQPRALIGVPNRPRKAHTSLFTCLAHLWQGRSSERAQIKEDQDAYKGPPFVEINSSQRPVASSFGFRKTNKAW